MNDNDFKHFLEITLIEAKQAFEEGNYPIGSLVVDSDGNVISQKRNQSFTNKDVSAHAEILNLQEIGKENKKNLMLFSSLEPCFGCSFFIARSPIIKIYSALKDPHRGGMSDLKKQDQFAPFFCDIELINEPYADLKEESRELMKNYFLSLGLEHKAKFYGYKADGA